MLVECLQRKVNHKSSQVFYEKLRIRGRSRGRIEGEAFVQFTESRSGSIP